MDGFNDKSASQIAEVGKKSVVLGRNYLYKRRGRHRKSDALIDYAIYNILKSGKAVSPIVVHRELSKNPLYNLSERTLRRRLAEFGNSRNALASRRPRSCEPVVDKISDDASFNSVSRLILNFWHNSVVWVALSFPFFSFFSLTFVYSFVIVLFFQQKFALKILYLQ